MLSCGGAKVRITRTVFLRNLEGKNAGLLIKTEQTITMKTKFVIGLIALSLLTLSAAAQNNTSQQQAIEKGPGMISPGSPFYGLEVAADNAAISVGLAQVSNVAQERAAEAKKATENNNTRGAQRAAQNLENVAKKAKDSDEEGITRAMSSMEEVIANAPNEEARQGMQTALSNMREAQQKRQNARQQGENTNERGQQPENTGDRPENTSDNQPSEQQNRQTDSQNTTDQQRDSNTSAGSQEQTS